MRKLVFNTVFFVLDVVCAISIYHQGRFVWTCIMSACAGIMFALAGVSVKELIENRKA